jgi:hypothetical protein
MESEAGEIQKDKPDGIRGRLKSGFPFDNTRFTYFLMI